MKTKESKEKWVDIARKHQEHDMFIQGEWLQDEKINGEFKGCMFGCFTQSDENTLEKASEEMGLPLWLVHVSEKIFEGLPSKEAIKFPLLVLENYNYNKESKEMYDSFMYEMLMNSEKGQITFTDKDSDKYNAIIICAELFKTGDYSNARSASGSASRSASGSEWSEWSARSASRSAESAESARSASSESASRSAESAESARSASRSASGSEWSEWSEWSARSAAESVSLTARSAAWLAWSAESASGSARSASWSASESAGSAHYGFLRDILIQSIK